MAPVLFTTHRDAQLDMDFSCHREHSPDGASADWWIGVAGGSAPPGIWNAEPASGGTLAGCRTVACCEPGDPAAHRHLPIHVFCRDQVLLHESLLDKDERLASRPALHFHRT